RPRHEQVADTDLRTHRRVQRETLALELDRVQTEVQEHGTVAPSPGEHDRGVRVERADRAGHGGEGIEVRDVVGHDREARPEHVGREDLVGHVLERYDRAWHGSAHERHVQRKACIWAASSSASGPTMTCTTRPERTTPNAPVARRPSSLTRAGSLTSTRKRVMHGSRSTTFESPPSAARICSALLITLSTLSRAAHPLG